MKIADVRAFPLSVPVPPGTGVRLGAGRAVKRDAVLVRVRTDDGLVGWGEAHHGRAPGAVARLVDTTLREVVIGEDPLDTVGTWDRVYRAQLRGLGAGTTTVLGLSGLDMALWDIRGKAAGLPLYRLFGGADRPVPAYAGGVALGFAPPAQLADDALAQYERGYRTVKIRIGDEPGVDLQRLTAVRAALPTGAGIVADANCNYDLGAVRQVAPELERLGVGWLEEPFPVHHDRAYGVAARLTTVPLAAGENHFTRFEFARLIEAGAVEILQPDLSKTGGPSEVLRIAALASAAGLRIHPHTSMTGLNMAATVHLLAAIDNAGYFEGDASPHNPLRDQLVPTPYSLDTDGCVRPLPGPGLGVDVDEAVLAAHPLIDGPCYV
jgi:D-galactarolactone cycloisomerase